MRQIAAEFATAPKAHQGVGDALRKAYVPAMAELPSEWCVLINQIK